MTIFVGFSQKRTLRQELRPTHLSGSHPQEAVIKMWGRETGQRRKLTPWTSPKTAMAPWGPLPLGTTRRLCKTCLSIAPPEGKGSWDILVSWCCCNRGPPTRWLQRWKLSQFWRPGVQDQGVPWLADASTPVYAFVITWHSPYVSVFIWPSSYWIRGSPTPIWRRLS